MKIQPYECPGPDCPSCSGEYCDIHFHDPCDCDVVARHASDYPAKEKGVNHAPATPGDQT